MVKYVARWSQNIEGDIQRGWSAWQSGQWGCADLGDFLSSLYLTDAYSEDELTPELLEEIAEENNVIFDEVDGCWRQFHHNGLSCYPLNAETVEEAIEIVSTENVGDGAGFGHRTIGKVRVVARIHELVDGENYALYVLECEDSLPEMN